ncbi:hypothetical protein B0H10DRAFT_1849948, partial [Mycena sp. CBHHK59/15]
LGYSKKGYTDSEIRVEWLKNFNQNTPVKAAHRCQLSHYPLAFLIYAHSLTAHEKLIKVIGYLSNSTYVYQGLDVVIFTIFKLNWSSVHDNYECEGKVVDKGNFLAVYAEAHFMALTLENIKAMFHKTGVTQEGYLNNTS